MTSAPANPERLTLANTRNVAPGMPYCALADRYPSWSRLLHERLSLGRVEVSGGYCTASVFVGQFGFADAAAARSNTSGMQRASTADLRGAMDDSISGSGS